MSLGRREHKGWWEGRNGLGGRIWADEREDSRWMVTTRLQGIDRAGVKLIGDIMFLLTFFPLSLILSCLLGQKNAFMFYVICNALINNFKIFTSTGIFYWYIFPRSRPPGADALRKIDQDFLLPFRLFKIKINLFMAWCLSLPDF